MVVPEQGQMTTASIFAEPEADFAPTFLASLEDGVGGLGHGFGRHVALVLEGDLARVGDDQPNGLAHVGQDFSEALAVDGTGGARNADNDLAHDSKPVALPFSLLFCINL